MKTNHSRKRKHASIEEEFSVFVPLDVWQVIFLFGTVQDLGRLEQVCKNFRNILSKVWEHKQKQYLMEWEAEHKEHIKAKQTVQILSHAEFVWKRTLWSKFHPGLLRREHFEVFQKAADVLDSKRAKRKFIAYWTRCSVEDDIMHLKVTEYCKQTVEDLKIRYKNFSKGTLLYHKFLFKYIRVVRRFGDRDNLSEWCFKKMQPLLEANYAKAYHLKATTMDSFTDLLKAAELGDRHAQYEVGAKYAKGNGVPQNCQEALKWYSKAVDQGFLEAIFNLGCLLNTGELGYVKRKEAFRCMLKSALRGHPFGQCYLSDMYRRGHGVKKNATLSFQWMLKSAQMGLRSAMFRVGLKYYNGEGVEKNIAEAVKWYSRATDLGHPVAMINLGICHKIGEGNLEQDYKKALELFTKSAELGEPYADWCLAELYEEGLGVKKNLRKAISHYNNAIKAHVVEAFTDLGLLYINGTKVKKNLPKGIELIAQAAEKGHAHGQYALSTAYRDAIGVEQDPKLSAFWCKRAAEAGHREAEFRLGYFFYTGYGVRKKFGLALEWWKKAAKQGCPVSCNNIGCMYQQGEGVQKDIKESEYWFNKAEELGYK